MQAMMADMGGGLPGGGLPTSGSGGPAPAVMAAASQSAAGQIAAGDAQRQYQAGLINEGGMMRGG